MLNEIPSFLLPILTEDGRLEGILPDGRYVMLPGEITRQVVLDGSWTPQELCAIAVYLDRRGNWMQ